MRNQRKIGAGRSTTTPIGKVPIGKVTARALGPVANRPVTTSRTDGVQPSQAQLGQVTTVAENSRGTVQAVVHRWLLEKTQGTPAGLRDIGKNPENFHRAFPWTMFSRMVRVISWV